MNSLIAESVWYVIDGYYYRVEENPEDNIDDFIKYNIEVNTYKFKFYKSLKTERWWVEFLNDEFINLKKDMISCSANDYFNCKNNVISDRILTRLKNKIT